MTILVPSAAKKYLTTPIYYLNGPPHLGHAYTTIVTDFMARFWRLLSHPTYFLTGTDEHGQKIQEAAETAGAQPQDHVNGLSQVFRDMTARVNAAPNDFIRTTEKRHITGAQAFWTALQDKGWIYKGVYQGWYAVRDEAFYKESDIQDGKAPTGAPVTWMEEPCFFFKLSAFQKPLLDFYAENPNFVRPKERFNEAISWVKQGLSDLAISRSTCTWGVPVPGQTDHVMYVWIDALSNYMNALGYPETTALMDTFWPSAHHVLGKDILRFHAIYWPAFLMAADLPPPQSLYVHGWWTNSGQKMSKSLGNVLKPDTLIEQYGLDPVRYFLLRHIPFGQDGDFSDAAMQTRLNADLANDAGNLFQRVLAFVQKCGGTVPVIENPASDAIQTIFPKSVPFKADLRRTLAALVQEGKTDQYLQHIWKGVALGNQFIDAFAPWTLAKSTEEKDHTRLKEGLFAVLDLLRHLAFYLLPAMPETAEKMLGQLGLQAPDTSRHAVFLDANKDKTLGSTTSSADNNGTNAGEIDPLSAASFTLVPGTPLPKPTSLFQKYDPDCA